MTSNFLSVSLFLFFVLLCVNTINSQYYGYGRPNYYQPYNNYQRGYYPPMPYPFYPPNNGPYPPMQYPQLPQQLALPPPPPTAKQIEVIPEHEFKKMNSTLVFQEGAVIDYEYIYDSPPPKTSMKKVMLAKRTKVNVKNPSKPKKDSNSSTNTNSVSSSYSNINGVIKNITNGVPAPVESNVKPMPVPSNPWFSPKPAVTSKPVSKLPSLINRPTTTNKPSPVTKPPTISKPVVSIFPSFGTKPLPVPKSETGGILELDKIPINGYESTDMLSEEDMEYSEEDDDSSEDFAPTNSKTDLSENTTRRSFWG